MPCFGLETDNWYENYNKENNKWEFHWKHSRDTWDTWLLGGKRFEDDDRSSKEDYVNKAFERMEKNDVAGSNLEKKFYHGT